MRRGPAGSRSMKKETPGFSRRAMALAAPKKLEPTMRPRATSSAHSTGALNHERSRTETMTTTRSAASRRAAVASVNLSNAGIIDILSSRAGSPPRAMTKLGFGAVDDVDDRLGLCPRLHEILGLRQHALAEGFLVAFEDGDALVGQHLQRLLLDREAMRAGVDRRLLRGVDEAVAQLGVHALEGGLAEIDRERREIVLGQRVELGGFVEFARQDGRRIVLQPVEHAGLQGGVDLAEGERRGRRAHQAQAFGDH